jgi:hypothetical protein
MKFTTTTVLASAAALAVAAPTPDSKPAVNDRFRIMTLRSGSDFQYSSVQAANRGFLINHPDQNSSCDAGAKPNYATFYLNEAGDLYLNTDNPPQQAVVDRSGMGQGNIQYTTGVQGIGKNQQRGPFKIDDESNLVFVTPQGPMQGFQACPNALGGGYSIWLAGDVNPGGKSNCVGFTARALKETEPIKCQYTDYNGVQEN